MYQRLTLARDLLTSDGVMLVCINDENRAKLEMLMDEVMPGRRIGSFAWRTKDTGNDASRKFSQVHEHVLVYGNQGFNFIGNPINKDKFYNQDNNGQWAARPITKAHSYIERPNTYYPIQDPTTGYWYPCDPDSVWRFASRQKMHDVLKDPNLVSQAVSRLRSEPIEDLIAMGFIHFPQCKPDETFRYETIEELKEAIQQGLVPRSPKKKTPLLREDLPDLEFWVGKIIASGRPSRKDYWDSVPESERTAPVSSWVAGVNESLEHDDDEEIELVEYLRSTRGGVSSDELKAIFGSKAFNFAKPSSLITNILRQAARADDIVLDFFAGSGTTGHAVLELNKEDGGTRSFILCSSTEANSKEPDKNLCRDVCAARIRQAIHGYADTPALGGDFAYLAMDLIEEADLLFEATPENAYYLLCLRETGQIKAIPDGSKAWLVAGNDGAEIYLCPHADDATIEELKHTKVKRLIIYTTRPDTLANALEGIISTSCYPLEDAMAWAQTNRKRVENDSAAQMRMKEGAE